MMLHSNRLALHILVLMLMLGTIPLAAAQDRIAERFDQLDTNGDGVLTPDELPMPRVFAMLDLDGDGRITREEATRAAGAMAPRQDRPRAPQRVTQLPGGVVSHRDLAYTEDENSPSQRLDVYTHAEAKDRPVVVMIHGGGWTMGDKANMQVVNPKAAYFVERGYVFVSINYRLSPGFVHPTHVEDCAAAIAWVHQRIGEYGGDPSKIVVMGHSAGAHLAALLGTDARRLGKHDLPLSTISGVVLLDGAGYDIPRTMDEGAGGELLRRMYTTAYTEDRALWDDASPVMHVAEGKGIPPFLLYHVGNRRESRDRSVELATKLTDAGVKAVVMHAINKTHGSINADLGIPDDPPTVALERFLDELFTNQDDETTQPSD